jgi:hypothetical protein
VRVSKCWLHTTYVLNQLSLHCVADGDKGTADNYKVIKHICVGSSLDLLMILAGLHLVLVDQSLEHVVVLHLDVAYVIDGLSQKSKLLRLSIERCIIERPKNKWRIRTHNTAVSNVWFASQTEIEIMK